MTKPMIGLHRRVHRPARPEDGPRRCDHQRFLGTAAAKKDALEAAGVRVVAYPTQIGEAVAAVR